MFVEGEDTKNNLGIIVVVDTYEVCHSFICLSLEPVLSEGCGFEHATFQSAISLFRRTSSSQPCLLWFSLQALAYLHRAPEEHSSSE